MKVKINLTNRGFSLIELVFAIFFMSVIILGVVNLQISNLGLINRQNNQIEAFGLANQGVEIIKSLPYDAQLAQCNNPCYRKLSFNESQKTYALQSWGDINDNEFLGNFERYFEFSSRDLKSGYLVRAIVEWEDSTGSHRRLDENGNEKNAHVEVKSLIFNP